MSINDAMEQLKQTILDQTGLVACVEVNLFPTRNPQLRYCPAAHAAASVISRSMGEEMQVQSGNDFQWISIGDEVTIYFNDLS